MYGVSLFDKVIFTLNSIVVLLLVLSCFAPYFSVKTFPFLAILSLMVPFIIALNLPFLIYWAFKRSKNFLLSALGIGLSFGLMGNFLGFTIKETAKKPQQLSIMSYNARAFNKYEWIKDSLVGDKITGLVRRLDPDIVCFQEFSRIRFEQFDHYAYKSLTPYPAPKSTQAIFSKYPIIGEGSLNLPNSINNIIFADILFRKDTIRVYNVHLESFGMTPGTGVLRTESTERLFEKLATSFKKQEEQAALLNQHSNSVSYRKIVCGDFNNTQFSRTYHLIKGGKKDTFIEKGYGFGKTYDFHSIPFRIDFILVDHEFEVKSHTNFDELYSDHYPIEASVQLEGY